MGYILDYCLNLLSKAVGDVSLFFANAAVGTMSSFGLYESEMPTALRPKDDDESAQ